MSQVIRDDLCKGGRRDHFACIHQLDEGPPLESIQPLRFGEIGHVRHEAVHVYDVIALALQEAAIPSVEGVLAAPQQRPHNEAVQSQLLVQLTAQAGFSRFACFQTAARCYPEMPVAIRRMDAHQQDFLRGGQQNCARGVAFNDQHISLGEMGQRQTSPSRNTSTRGGGMRSPTTAPTTSQNSITSQARGGRLVLQAA